MEAIWALVAIFGLAITMGLGVYTFAWLMVRFANPKMVERHPNPEYEKFLEQEFGPRYIPGQDGHR